MSLQTACPIIMIRVPAAEQIRVPVIVIDGGDPTGHPVEFALIPEDENPTVWSTGGWGDWNASSRTADAITPTIGGPGSGATFERAHGRWALWLRITLPSETVVRRPAIVQVC